MRARHPLLWYFALAFVISWTGVLLAESQHNQMLWFLAMLLGPSTASIALTILFEDTRGLRELVQRLLTVRVGRWYAAALFAPAILIGVLIVMSALSPRFTPTLLTTSSPGSVIIAALIAGIGAGIFEELGWTGFVTPRLLRSYSWFGAGMIIGIPWAIWHMLPDYLGHAEHGALWFAHAVQWFIALTAFRAFMTWVYSRTRSLSLAMLLHATFTGSQALLWPTAAGASGELVWYGLFGCALWLALGLGILVSERLAGIGASARERAFPLPGDALVPDPLFEVTHAINVDASPEEVWPWLQQMGSSRGGWYSYDFVDNEGKPSAKRVISDYQDVAIGEVMPALPGATDAFVVASIDAPYDLVLMVPGEGGRPVVSWEHYIRELDDGSSRLIVRGRVARSLSTMARKVGTSPEQRPIERVYGVLGKLPDAITIPIARLGHRWMEARHMRGIKRRVEAM